VHLVSSEPVVFNMLRIARLVTMKTRCHMTDTDGSRRGTQRGVIVSDVDFRMSGQPASQDGTFNGLFTAHLSEPGRKASSRERTRCFIKQLDHAADSNT
jgi:hypothetical protein